MTASTESSNVDHSLVRGLTISHFIDGDFVEGGTAPERHIMDPSRAEVICQAPDADAPIIQKAIGSARDALQTWRRQTPGARADVMFALADKVTQSADELAALESLNTGKPVAAARDEVLAGADVLRFMAGCARSSQAPATNEYTSGLLSLIQREPVGVVAGIAPWNYPLMMAIWKIAPAMAGGNTVVLKPSEFTPLSTLLLMQLCQEVVPAGVVNLILGAGEAGGILAEASGVDMVSFTGSAATGRVVAAAASTSVKRLHLELGGKSPVIVFDDADIEAMAAGVRIGAFWNAGQDCGAATRVLCSHRMVDQVLDALRTAADTLVIGGPTDGSDVEMGPIISQRQLDRVVGYTERAVAAGAQVVTGARRVDRQGYFYAPTILTNVARDSEIVREEVFGPVVTVESVSSDEEALAAANASEYGLAASVWTRDLNRALTASRVLDFGTVWTNNHLATATEMPWGGFAQSGYGRDLSAYSLDDHTRTKHVMIQLDDC